MHSLRPNLTAGIPRFTTLPDGVYDLALGNGSAYEVGVLRSPRGLYVGVGGYGFYGFDMPVDWTYVAEKLRLREGDARNVADFIADQLCPSAERQGCYHESLCHP
jgi:hypothetical protein